MTLYINGTTGISGVDGSAATPALQGNDTNTGISFGSDVIIGSTGGVERFRVDSQGRLAIGSTAPAYSLDIVGDLRVTNNAGSTIIANRTSNPGSVAWQHSGTETGQIQAVSGGGLNFYTGSSPSLRATLDNSGRLLVGTSSARSNFFNTTNITPGVQIENTDNSGAFSIVRQSNDTGGAFIALCKSRGTAVGANTLVSNGDDLGGLFFLGSDGTEFVAGAGITGQVDGTPGANDMPGRLVFSTTADGASSPTERMRITNGGIVATYCSGDVIYANTTQGAGTTYNLIRGGYSATDSLSSQASFRVYSNGNVQNTNNSYGALSDLKLKENIVDAGSQWSDIKALRVRNYNLKKGQTHRQIGLVAQEAEIVSPGLVYESPDRDENDNDLGTVTKSVNYSVLYMKAVKALQEAMERIETLEAKVAALEGV